MENEENEWKGAWVHLMVFCLGAARKLHESHPDNKDIADFAERVELIAYVSQNH